MATLAHYFILGGWVMWPILGLSVLALAIAAERGILIRREVRRESVLFERLRRELGDLRHGVSEWDRKAAFSGSTELRRIESNLGWLPIIANTATLTGLFGTVLGMCEVFQMIAEAGGPADPRLLAGGIWTALLTTVAGLAVAIPTTLAHHFLQHRVDGMAARLGEALEEIRDAMLAAARGEGAKA